ncbi:MAG TPA: ADOP family duplicated permease [Vicinamibacterales bacterium]|nr:ADOP family duplicated permease [Vicinamibacterales bacterium]
MKRRSRQPRYLRLFRTLLRLFPAEFRGDFGGDMEADFTDQHRDAARNGRRETVGLWLRTAPSIARAAAVEWGAVFVSDLRFAFRFIARAPGFAMAAVATLAIGIGATTAVFSVVNATLLRPLPFPDPGQLVSVRTRTTDGRLSTGLLSPVEMSSLLGVEPVVESVGGYGPQPVTITLLRSDGAPVPLLATGVTEGFFDALRLPMAYGRAFTHEEHAPIRGNVPPSAVLSYSAWKTLFGADPAVVGRNIRVAEGSADVPVVGVAAPELDLPHGTDLWFNLRTQSQAVNHNYDAILRLRPGATIEQLRSAASVQMTALARTVPSDANREFVVRPLVAHLVGDLRPTLLIVLGATLLLLLLASGNVTNLLLARATARSREMAVRAALGAGRGRVVRQVVTESLVLASLGTAAGVLLGLAGVRFMLVLGASKLPRLQSVPFDWRVLVFAAAVLGCSTLIMAAAPAWRIAGFDIRALLNESGRTTSSTRGTSRTMRGLIVAEIALALALVAGAAWLVQSFARLRSADTGFISEGRVVVDVRPTRRFNGPGDVRAWTDRLLESIRAASGGALVGTAGTFPFTQDRDGTLYIGVQGEARDPDDMRGARIRSVGPNFFNAMGITLIAGRPFSNADRTGSEPVAIVNQAFVRMFFPNGDALNRSVAFGYPKIDPHTASRIVGIVADVRYASLAEDPEPACYLPLAQLPTPPMRQAVVVATPGRDPEALIAVLREALRRFDPGSILTFTPAAAIVGATLERQQLGMTLMVIFGAIALALAAIGIYGVIAYASAQRRGEMATRMALGASRWDVFSLVMASGRRFGVLGLLLGVAVAYAGGRIIAGSVFGMRPSDPLILAGACAIVGAVTVAATAIPALALSRLDPSRALRSE